ncbi:MAG: TonB-dependent receptor [Bacteroidota bacterium]
MKCLLPVATMLISASLTAQDSLNVLDPVTVTATISPAQTSKTGRNIIVIKGEQFAKLPVNSLDELLRYVPGIEIQARGPMGSQSDILIRGGTFQQVLVILDGIRLNDPLTGHFNSYMPVAPSEIDRIEVLKGASSAIYGTEAVGGVIHIISKSFAQSIKKSTASARIVAGEYGLLNLQAGGQYTDSKNTFSGGLISNHTNGQPQRGTKGYFDLTTASLSYARKLTEHWNLALRSAYDDRSFSAQNYYTTFASDTATETVKTWWNHAQVAYSSSFLKWNLNLGYKTVDDHYLFNAKSIANENKSNLFQFLTTADLSFTKKTTLTTGIQYVSKGIKSNDRGDHTVWQSAAFVVLHQSIGEHFYVDPALRFDYNQRGGFELVPQLNASFRGDKYQLRTSIGRTIRDADFTERFNNYNKSIVTGGRIGNPDLEAETSFSYELGGDLSLSDNIKISGTWFERFHQKLIDYITTPYNEMPRKENLSSTGTYALARNFSKVNTNGWETDIQFQQPINSKQQLTATVGFLWLKSKLDGGGTPGFYLNAHAKFLTNFSISYQYNWLNISVNGVYKTRQPQEAAAIHATVSKDYFVANAKADVSIRKFAGVFIQADNIGNISYSDLLGTPMPGRWLMGGIRFNL